jgi:hypothetical protein
MCIAQEMCRFSSTNAGRRVRLTRRLPAKAARSDALEAHVEVAVFMA